MHLTPKAALISLHLEREVGEGIVDTITHLRRQGISWRMIAKKVSEWSGIRITHGAIEGWAKDWGIDEATEVVAS